MKVLLVGGSGFVGGHMARYLLDKGHEVTVFSRGGGGHVRGVSYISGDVVKNQGLKEAAKGHEAIVYLVGIIRETNHQTFKEAHVVGVQNVIAAAKAAGIQRFVHMSALGATKGSGSRYFETKADAEELLQASGLGWTILRPSLIFGQGDDFFGHVLKGLIRAPVPFIPLIGDGSFPFRPIWIGDVSAAFEQCLTQPQTIGKIFNLVGPKEYSFKQLLTLVRNSLGSSKPLLSIPLGLMDVVVPLISKLPFSPITLDQYLMLKAGNTADPSYMEQAFSLSQRSLEVELSGILTTKRLVGA